MNKLSVFDNLFSGGTTLPADIPTTPHLYRDIVAYAWLQAHPEDYLTVSKLLWHKNISTTIRIYGHRFDESTGVARMDNWRAKEDGNVTPGTSPGRAPQ